LSVGTWNPQEQVTELTEAVLDELLAAAEKPPSDDFGLSPTGIERLAGTARTNLIDWHDAAKGLADDGLIALVRLYVLAEGRFTSWKAGKHSPVIVLARTLRSRSAWPAGLTAWIKCHSDNKFLPYDSLMDRL